MWLTRPENFKRGCHRSRGGGVVFLAGLINRKSRWFDSSPRSQVWYNKHMNRQEYMKKYHREWYQKVVIPRKQMFFKNKKCQWCGSTENLEIHHVDPSQKLGHKIWSWRDEKREAELTKCIVLCRKCHQSHHKEEMIKHGSVSRYNSGCRCDACKAAKRAKYLRLKAKHKNQ